MKVLHLIESLNYGGAEQMMMDYIPEMKNHNHFVICFEGGNSYPINNFEYFEYNLSLPKKIFTSILKVKKFIYENEIEVLHSHTYWSNIITRFITNKIKIVNHYHFADYDTNKSFKMAFMIFLDRILFRKCLTRVAVSKYLKNILEIKLKTDKISYLPNFIQCNKSLSKVSEIGSSILRIIAVGNFNKEKNYESIFEAFEILKEYPITLDIIGGGGSFENFIDLAKKKNLKNINFLGYVEKAREKLNNYDLYLSASISETFGLSVLEATCASLPLVLSNIPSFKEIAPPQALFFDLGAANNIAESILNYYKNPIQVNDTEYTEQLHKYSISNFITSLNKIYSGS